MTGTGEARALPTPPGFARLQDVSPDGRTELFSQGALDTGVFAARLDGTGDAPGSLVQTGEVIMTPRFAPDGRWIGYAAAQGQDSQGIYVQPFPGPGLRRQISSGGNRPVWRPPSRHPVRSCTKPAETRSGSGHPATVSGGAAKASRLAVNHKPPSTTSVCPVM